MENVDKATDTIDTGARPTAQPENEGESRNRNLEILKAYIQRQRSLLERIKQDVDRLQSTKPIVLTESSSTLGRILHVDNDDFSQKREESLDAIIEGVGKLSELVSEVHGVGEATITKDIDWNVFKGSDLAPLHPLQPRSRTSLIPSSAHFSAAPPLTPSTPSLTSSRSSLSSFVSLDCAFERSVKSDESVYQIRVREQRVKAVDPALTIAAQFLASLPPDSDDECVKQARAKEARKAKEAKVREAKEARQAKLQSKKTNATTNAIANPASKKGNIRYIKKSASRRKSEASAAAAAIRPRGHGGRFKKKEPEQVVDQTSAPDIQAAGASTSTSGPAVSIAISAASIPDLSSSTKEPGLASSGPSVISLYDDAHYIGNGRPQRTRKPSTRFGSAAPSVSSSRSTRSGSSGSSRRNSRAEPDWSPVVPNNPLRGRLTIRIPARVPAKSAAANTSEQMDGQLSASTSMATSTTIATAASGNISQMLSAENRIGSSQYEPDRWALATENGARTLSPVTATFSASQASFLDVKQEEDERENEMDIDNWEAFGDRNGRYKQDAAHVKYEPSSRGNAMDMSDDEHESASDDSFTCELLPPVPGSATSSSSASRAGVEGGVNGSVVGKTDTSRGPSRRGDPSSKTFNVAWSDEEQRLLDMLLEQYPDGTKNRWANISRAMGGTRTPRQVASRVQKYFAKMKKWGIDVS